MASPRVCKRRRLIRLVAAVAAVPFLLWGAVLLVAPTGWASGRIVRELEEVTGRKVAIEAIRLGPLGNLRVRGLALAEHATPDDPWLKVAEARLDVHLLAILTGRCRPTDVDVDGLDLRVHRRLDGSLEFADLLAGDARPARPSGEAAESRRSAVSLRLRGARVVLIDDPEATRLELADAEGESRCDGILTEVSRVRGRLNGGSFDFAAKFDRSGPAPAFHAELSARGVDLDEGVKTLALLVPVVAGAGPGASIRARCDMNLVLKGRGDSIESIKDSLVGHGSIRLDPIDLTDSKVFAAFRGAQGHRANKVGSVASHFAIANRRVTTDDLTITVARLPTTLAGWTDFDGRIDYELKADALDARLPSEARRFLGELKQDLGELAHLRIGGTIDAPEVFAGSLGIVGGPRELADDDKARLHEAARVLREKYLR